MPLTPRLSRVESCLTPLAPLTPWQARHLVTLGSLEDCLTPLTPRLSCVAGAALGDFLEGWAASCRWRGWHQAVPRGTRGTWCLTLCMESPLTLLTPLAPRLSFAAGAAIGDFLEGCLMPLTPRLSRVAGAALGDSLEGCLTPLTPLTPRLVTLWRGWCRWRRWRRRCLAWHARYFWPLGDSLHGELPLTPLTPRLSRVAGAELGDSGGLLDAVDDVDAAIRHGCLAWHARHFWPLGDSLEGCVTPLMPRLVAVSLGRRQTWWRSGGLLDAVDAVDTAHARHLVTLCMEGCLTPWTPLTPRLFAWQAPYFKTPWRAAWCRWRRWRRWHRWRRWRHAVSHHHSRSICVTLWRAAAVTWLTPLWRRWCRWRRDCLAWQARHLVTLGRAAWRGRHGCLARQARHLVTLWRAAWRRWRRWRRGCFSWQAWHLVAPYRRTAWRRGTWWLCGELLDAIWTSLNRVNSVWNSFNRVWTSLNRVWTSHEPFW